MKSSHKDDIRFFTEVHLLASKLVLVVAIHSLRDSRANWHHKPNPQQGATQSAQDENHTSHEQFTRVPFGSPPGKGQEPLTITTIRAKTITFLRSTILAAPSHLGGGNHQEKQMKSAAKHNHQVPLDAITQSNALGCSQISLDDDPIKQGELECWLCSQGCILNTNG